MPTYFNHDALAKDYPKIARAVAVVRRKLGFQGNVRIYPFRGMTLGTGSYSGTQMTFHPKVEKESYSFVLDVVVHEAIHCLGIHHMKNYRSGRDSGRRCYHGRDVLSHQVATLLDGSIYSDRSFSTMVKMHRAIGAHSKLLLRQLVRVDLAAKVRNGVPSPIVGNTDVDVLVDGRAERWQRMSPEERTRQLSAMYVGRLKSLGYHEKEIESIL